MVKSETSGVQLEKLFSWALIRPFKPLLPDYLRAV